MISQAPSTAQDLRLDAHNARRLTEIARTDREKRMLLSAANEFLNKAAELEAVSVAPAEATARASAHRAACGRST